MSELKHKWLNELAWIDTRWNQFCSKKLTITHESKFMIQLEDHYKLGNSSAKTFKKPLLIFVGTNCFYDYKMYEAVGKALNEARQMGSLFNELDVNALQQVQDSKQRWPSAFSSMDWHLSKEQYENLCFSSLGRLVDQIKQEFEAFFGAFAKFSLQYKYYPLSGAKGYEISLGMQWPVLLKEQYKSKMMQMPLGLFNRFLRKIMSWMLSYIGESEKVQNKEWSNTLEDLIFNPLMDQMNAGLNQYAWYFIDLLKKSVPISIDSSMNHWHLWDVKQQINGIYQELKMPSI